MQWLPVSIANGEENKFQAYSSGSKNITAAEVTRIFDEVDLALTAAGNHTLYAVEMMCSTS